MLTKIPSTSGKFIITVVVIMLHLSIFNAFSQSEDTVLLGKSVIDTVKISVSDTTFKKKKNLIEAKVIYKSDDSLRFQVTDKNVFLYNNSDISYQKINLQANFVNMNFNNSQVFAKGLEDSTGILKGTPVFKEGEKSFKCIELYYNFNSKKGLIKQVITQESEGFIHGEKVKKMADDITFIRHGKYTTCDLDHPHFDIRFGKAKVIPEKKIITGPAFLYIEDIPTPLFVPLGYFPNTKKQSSGILFPTYGESPNRGFFFENGGYYFAISDYIDLALRGDIYTRGSWALRSSSSYNRRYKYNGNFSIDFAKNIYGELNTPDYNNSTDFSVRWSHNQDAKARPNSRFSANVNLVSSKYNQFSQNANDFLTNTTISSISYSTNFGNNYFLTVDLGQSYNTNTRIIDLNLPTLAFNTSRFYPFKKSLQKGNPKWYENIMFNYSMNAQNKINTYDSILFTQKTVDNMQNGVRHSIPVTSSLNVLKYFTLTNSVSITERWYFETTNKEWSSDSLFSENGSFIGFLKTNKVKEFARAFDFIISSSLNTRLYGIAMFNKGYIRAVRHVITPSVSFSWRPDFGTSFWGYYKSYTDNNGNTHKYSKFESSLYGTPSDGKYGSVGFSISNNVEIKVKSAKDTVTGTKKIVLIENFSLASSYNLAADSLNWSPLTMNGRTTLFKNVFISYSSIWDPYAKTAANRRINKYEWDLNRRLLRLDNTSWNVGLNMSLNSSTFKKNTDKSSVQNENIVKPPSNQSAVTNINEVLGDVVDFDIPWNLTISYNFNYSSNYNAFYTRYDKNYIQTLSFSGDFNLTKKWKIGFHSGYDFELKDFSYTSLDIYRDLHCWEMRFNWIPLGFRQSWSFTINVKASVLKDLKWDKRKDFRDRTQ